jgi:hypothetical protein
VDVRRISEAFIITLLFPLHFSDRRTEKLNKTCDFYRQNMCCIYGNLLELDFDVYYALVCDLVEGISSFTDPQNVETIPRDVCGLAMT